MFLSPSNATVKQLLKNKLRDYFKDINSQKQKDEGSDISNKTLRAGKSWCMCCNCHNFGPPPLFCFIFSLAGSWSGAWGWEEVLQIHREPTWMSWPEGIRGRGRDIQDKPYSVWPPGTKAETPCHMVSSFRMRRKCSVVSKVNLIRIKFGQEKAINSACVCACIYVYMEYSLG